MVSLGGPLRWGSPFRTSVFGDNLYWARCCGEAEPRLKRPTNLLQHFETRKSNDNNETATCTIGEIDYMPTERRSKQRNAHEGSKDAAFLM